MKTVKTITLIMALLLILAGCNAEEQTNAMKITLGSERILLNGEAVGSDPESAVYTATDIIYYESGKDFTYGEGDEKDAHTLEEAAAHTVVHITQPGTYSISGKLDKGQIAVDLGKDAKDDPEAVVTLILDGADITCEVAPAVIFYNVYECGTTENPTKDVDTTKAGANVIIADGSENTVNGAYVARIYKPDSVVLNPQGTEVEDAKKLHKYDGAFYSKMSMNISGEKKNSGTLNIQAKNEGLDTEMHLTINGGNINIRSGNDGINTNEDGVSVTTINGGNLNILVTGETGEGDGIDSNGYLVINDGKVTAAACSRSADAGIDSDMGIHINGGTVIASGSMLDRIEEGGQTYAVFMFRVRQKGTDTISMKNEKGKSVLSHTPENDYSTLIFSSPDLQEGTYTLWSGETQLAGQSGSFGGGMGGFRPGGFDGKQPPEGFDGTRPQEGFSGMETPKNWGDQKPDEQPPEDQPIEEIDPEEPMRWPGDGERPQKGERPTGTNQPMGELSEEFKIVKGANYFMSIYPKT